MKKIKKQIAALPVRVNSKGQLRVLLITSRETRRWVMPKGWTMNGKKPWRAAEIEAMEEAGVKGVILHDSYGSYDYKKRLSGGRHLRCRVKLFPMQVNKMMKRWPEQEERTRRWFKPKRAARLVREPELSELLMQLSRKKVAKPILKDLAKQA